MKLNVSVYNIIYNYRFMHEAIKEPLWKIKFTPI